MSHLVELRDRLLKSVLAVLLVFLGLVYFANSIHSVLAEPLMRHLPAGSRMIAIEVASPFLIPFKLTLAVSVLIVVPFILYQAWAFVAPGLCRHERRLFFPILGASTVLFHAGMAFAYFAVFPVIFGFMATAAPQGVAVMTDISHHLDFVLSLLLAFGAVFEVPILTWLAVKSGAVDYRDLKDKRPHAIVAAFLVGAILTPPDVVSQTLMAVPIWLLFEAGVVLARCSAGKSPRGTKLPAIPDGG